MVRQQSDRHLGHLLRGEILSRWEQLTPPDIEECGSDCSKLADVLQTRYGYARRRAEKEVDLFFDEFHERLRRAA